MDSAPNFIPEPEIRMQPMDLPPGGPADRKAEGSPKIAVRELNFYYGAFQALHNINIDIPEKTDHGIDRAFGLRQIDVSAHARTASTK